MKHSETEKSPWIKRKTMPGLNMKKIDEFHPDRRQNLAESDKGSWFNQLSECEATLNVSAVRKKKYWEAGERERERKRERLPKTSPDYSSSSDSSLYETNASLHF